MSQPDINQKAHDIAFAVFRVAALVKHSRLKSELENAAILLVSEENPQAVDKLGNLVHLTETVGEMSRVNSLVLQRELKSLNSAIAESAVGNDEEVNLEEEFARAGSATIGNPATIGNDEKVEEISPHIINRQSAILEFIRQLPDSCRMRDLTVKFPEVSERTLRNDLQTLNAEGLLERTGKGPFSFFRAVTKKEVIAL